MSFDGYVAYILHRLNYTNSSVGIYVKMTLINLNIEVGKYPVHNVVICRIIESIQYWIKDLPPTFKVLVKSSEEYNMLSNHGVYDRDRFDITII